MKNASLIFALAIAAALSPFLSSSKTFAQAPAKAEAAYPNRPIRVIVAYSPGGGGGPREPVRGAETQRIVRAAGGGGKSSRGERNDRSPGSRQVGARRLHARFTRCSIHKVCEVDPLECPKCPGPMRVIALIEDVADIRRILVHLRLWAPRHQAPRPARPPPAQETGTKALTLAKNLLSYHPVPDIA